MSVKIQKFEFNPFAENTYVLYDDSLQCVIIDPGCSNHYENSMLQNFIQENKLTPVEVWLTHAHVDHIAGLQHVCDYYKIGFVSHKSDEHLLKQATIIGRLYGINIEEPGSPSRYFEDDDMAIFGETKFQVAFTPGHCPGEVCLINHEARFVIAGDVLFRESIGRTDLPGGNFEQLSHSIQTKLFCLPDVYKVYCGHGPETTIGHEKKYNPFLN